jgi:hypothetical protein
MQANRRVLAALALLIVLVPAHGSAMEVLEDFCGSKEWEDQKALQKLTLTGLQPCFEDMILLGMVYIGFFGLLSYRIVELLGTPKQSLAPLETEAKIWLACRCLACLVEIIVPIMLLSEAITRDEPATFEKVIYPVRAVVWVMLLITMLIETGKPTPKSLFKYLLRVLYLWALVADSVRWSSQEALSNIDGLENQFRFFIIAYIPLVCLVIGNYFIPSEYDTQKIDAASQDLNWHSANEREMQELDNPMGDTGPPPKQRFSQFIKPSPKALAPKPTERNMEVRAGPLSRILFNFITPVIRRGYKVPLEEGDIWPLAAKFSSAEVAKKFRGKWEMVQQEITDNAKANGTSKEETPAGPGLVTVLWRSFGWSFMNAAPLLLVQNLAGFIPPIIIGRVVLFVDDPDAPVADGYLLCLGFFLVPIFM